MQGRCSHILAWFVLGVLCVLQTGAVKQHPAGLTEINEWVRNRFPGVLQMTVSELHARLSKRTTVPAILIDAREQQEYEVSHIRGAELANTKGASLELLRHVARDRLIVVYCSVGYRSSKLAEKLQDEGFTNVYNLEGSIFAWANAGMPVYRNGERTDKVHPFNDEWGRFLRPKLRYKK